MSERLSIGSLSRVESSYTVPGVFVLDWVPSLGNSILNTDPASIAGKEIYARVRANFSGSLAADAPDFIVYLMSLDSIYAYIAYLKRLYRLLNAWSPNNYVLPETVLGAMSLSESEIRDLRANRTKLWQCINELIYQSSKFTCPNQMHIMNRHYWLSDNLFTDANTVNSQFYLLNLVKVYQFKELPTMDDASVNAGGLTQVNLPNAVFGSGRSVTVDSLYNFGLQLIQALVDWDDAYTINGYLMKAYSDTPMFTVDLLPQDAELLPVYDEEVLSQIENATPIYNGISAYYVSDITMNMDCRQSVTKNILNSNPSITYTTVLNAIANVEAPFISLRSDTPNAADVIIASRLKSATTPVPITGTTYPIFAGTELCMGFRLVTSAPGTTISSPAGTAMQTVVNGSSTSAFILGTISQFDWHPILVITNADGTQFTFFGDVHNVTNMSLSDFQNINRVCVFSELNAFA